MNSTNNHHSKKSHPLALLTWALINNFSLTKGTYLLMVLMDKAFKLFLVISLLLDGISSIVFFERSRLNIMKPLLEYAITLKLLLFYLQIFALSYLIVILLSITYFFTKKYHNATNFHTIQDSK